MATVLTDSVAMYESRLQELRDQLGEYTPMNAAVDERISAFNEAVLKG